MASSIFRHMTRLQAGNLIYRTANNEATYVIVDFFTVDTYWVPPATANLTTLGAGR